MENEKYFIKGDGKLVILYNDEFGTKHLSVCEPIENVTLLSVGVVDGKKGKKGQRFCKKCKQPGHRSDNCPN